MHPGPPCPNVGASGLRRSRSDGRCALSMLLASRQPVEGLVQARPGVLASWAPRGRPRRGIARSRSASVTSSGCRSVVELGPRERRRHAGELVRAHAVGRCERLALDVLQVVDVHRAPSCRDAALDGGDLRVARRDQRGDDPAEQLPGLVGRARLERDVDVQPRGAGRLDAARARRATRARRRRTARRRAPARTARQASGRGRSPRSRRLAGDCTRENHGSCEMLASCARVEQRRERAADQPRGTSSSPSTCSDAHRPAGDRRARAAGRSSSRSPRSGTAS